MNFLTPDDLNALIELVESNNQYNTLRDENSICALNQAGHHGLKPSP